MKRFRKIIAYPKPGKTNLLFCRGKSGVYMIFKGDTLLYIGMSGSDLYKTITRHFQDWKDSRQVRTTYPQKPEYKINVVFCTPQRAGRLERYLIVRLKPIDNPDKLQNYTLDSSDNKTGQEFAATYLDDPPF